MMRAKAYIADEDPLKRRVYEVERRNLIARQHLSHQRKLILDQIELLKERQGLGRCIDGLDTTVITRKSGSLRNKYLTQKFKDTISEEQTALNMNFAPEVTTKAIKGTLLYRTDVAKEHKNSHIISEGEHRALALAGFLAEVRSISDNAPIVIDDPVSSLDHRSRAAVAERIVQEARRRQAIVFTHDVYFFAALTRIAEQADVPIEGVGLFRKGAETGLIDLAGEPWDGKSVDRRMGKLKEYLAQIKRLANESPTDYSDAVKKFYSRLRDTWERVVEERLFKGIITRYSPEVSTKELRYIDLSDEVYERIHAGMTGRRSIVMITL